MILFRADANTSIDMGHIMRTLSIADALSSITFAPSIISGKNSIKFVVADDSVVETVRSRGYEPIILNTDYSDMESELPVWENLQDSIDSDLLIIDSYYVTPNYLSWLRDNIGTVCYIDDVLSFPYPVDILINYNAFSTLPAYQELYKGLEAPEMILGPAYAPLRSSFAGVERREQREKVKDVLLSTGGSDELHIALHFLQYLCDQHESRGVDGITYHILLGAMNTDKEAIKSIAEKMDRVVIHENVVDMKSLICSCDLVISAAGSTLYEICACGTPLITYSVADNQVPGAEAFASLGLAVDISDLRDPTSIDHTAVMSGTLAKDAVEKLIRTEHMLAEDVEKRKVMSQKMQTLIDGRGAERLSRELMNTVNRNIRNMMI